MTIFKTTFNTMYNRRLSGEQFMSLTEYGTKARKEHVFRVGSVLLFITKRSIL